MNLVQISWLILDKQFILIQLGRLNFFLKIHVYLCTCDLAFSYKHCLQEFIIHFLWSALSSILTWSVSHHQVVMNTLSLCRNDTFLTQTHLLLLLEVWHTLRLHHHQELWHMRRDFQLLRIRMTTRWWQCMEGDLGLVTWQVMGICKLFFSLALFSDHLFFASFCNLVNMILLFPSSYGPGILINSSSRIQDAVL